eukprot:10039045-Lingulodinium_polyedra.AAC.1
MLSLRSSASRDAPDVAPEGAHRHRDVPREALARLQLRRRDGRQAASGHRAAFDRYGQSSG